MKRVKKIISVLLIAMTTMSWVGCGKSNDGGGNKPASTQGEGKQEEKKDEGKVNSYYVKDPLLPGSFIESLPEFSFIVDAPIPLPKGRGTGQVAETKGCYAISDLFVEGCSDKEYGADLSKIKTPKDAFNQMEKQFLFTTTLPLGHYQSFTFKIVKEEDRKVNEWDMHRVEGYFQAHDTRWPVEWEKANFVAYSVIKEGYPVYFVVVDDPENPEDKDIGDVADRMAKTFRNNDRKR